MVGSDTCNMYVDSALYKELLCFALQYVARGMVERGDEGAIVNVSSVASFRAIKDHLVYCECCSIDIIVLYMVVETVGCPCACADMQAHRRLEWTW